MLKKTSLHTLLSTLVGVTSATLAVSALSGCGSSTPDASPKCVSADGLWEFPTCNATDYVYVGVAGVPCTTPDALWFRTNCADPMSGAYQGECATNDPNWKLANCSDPASAVWIGAGPAPTAVDPSVMGQAPPVATAPPTAVPTTPGTTAAPANPTVAPPGTATPTPTTPGVVPTTPAPTGTDPAVVPPVGTDPATTATDTTVPPTPPGTGTPPPVATDTPPSAVTVPDRTCPAYEGLIADFEENSAAVLPIEGRLGLWEGFNDADGTRVDEVIQEGTEACNQGVFHTSGSGFTSYVGLGATVASPGTFVNDNGKTEYQPAVYDAPSKGFVGVSFRAKAGAGNKTPVRFAVATPWTDGGEFGDGSCDTATDSTHPCYNHLGQFLIDEEALTTEWKTFTFCFDRDLHPEWLPSGGTTAQRNAVGANVFGLQFKFNQGMDPATFGGTVATYARTQAFDFYLDDVRFVKTCGDKPLFQSTGGASAPFPQNKTIGNCALTPNAARFNAQVSEAYLRWKQNFVRSAGSGLQVWSNEDNRSISESIGYGMLITAAMGDKEVFDGLFTYWKSQSQGGSALMRWVEGGNGTATDADTDAAYAVMMANAQWGGYDAAPLVNDVVSMDFKGDTIGAGSDWPQGVFNPSYFSPSFYRAFQKVGNSGAWGTAVSSGYGLLNSCSSIGGALPADWCSNGTATDAASVNAQVTSIAGTVYAFDAARTPWRIGLDSCVTNGDATAKAYVTKLVNFFAGKYTSDRIDLMKAGFTSSGTEHNDAENNQMSFIGPVGVAAMASGDSVMYERALLTVLDIMERPEFYGTYYPATVGMLSLLTMTGNFPQLGN